MTNDNQQWDKPEISVRTFTCMLLYFEEQYGSARLEAVWRENAMPLTIEYLRKLTNYVSLRFLERFLEVMTAASGDPAFVDKSARKVATPEGLGFVYYLFRGAGTPALAYRKSIEIGALYNRVGDFSIDRLTDTTLDLSYKSRVPEESRLVCRGRMANFVPFPTIWDLPEAEITQSQCQLDGADCCKYHLSWKRRAPVQWRRWLALPIGVAISIGFALGVPAAALVIFACFVSGAWLDAKSLASRHAVELEENVRELGASLAELQQRSDEVFKANVELEDRVASRTAELEQALLQLRKVDRLKAEFFANVSHELRTPLTLILGPIEDQLTRPMPAAQQLMFEGVRRNAVRLLRLIDDLLDLSRIDGGHLRLSLTAVDVGALASQLVALFEGAAKVREITLVSEVPEGVSTVWGDLHRLDSILSNLLGNAMKFTPRGGTIKVRATQTDSGVQISVTDTGPGISSDDLPHIFDRFYQAPTGSKPKGGVGIGLALARHLAELHGGTLDAQSESGAGATFTLELPKGREHFDPQLLERRHVQRDASPARRAGDLLPERPEPLQLAPVVAATVAASADGRRPRILVVEDNDEVREMLHGLLTPAYEVLTASSGESGLELARSSRPELVLSDVMMPGLKGTGLCSAIKQDPALRSIPVLLLTARSGTEAALEGFSSGADDFIEKPFHPRVLLARIQAQLRLQAMMARLAADSRLAAVGTLAGGVGHEIRNPVNAVLNGIRVLQKRSGADSSSARLLEVIADGAARIEYISSALLTHVSPAEHGGRRPIDLREGLESTLLLLEHRLNGVEVHRAYDAQDRVVGAAADLNQVFLNLIDNAVRSGARNIWLGIAREDGGVSVSVKNDGPVIPPEVAGQLFTPFFTTREPGEGTGLGLYLTRQAVERCGGRVELASRPGETTVFKVRIPGGTVSVSAFVLYVDDEAANRLVFEEGLGDELPVLTAGSGAEALELLSRHEVAVLLTDQRMPGMTGVDLLAAAQASNPDTIRMLITAYSDLKATIDAINRGQAHQYLEKPWHLETLKATLKHARDRFLFTKRLTELETRLLTTERMYSLGVIAAGVAHEIRNPLTGLHLNLELVGSILTSDPLEAKQLQLAKSTVEDCKEATQTITDICQSIELATRSREDSEVDLREVVELAARAVRGEALRRGKIVLELTDVPLVRGSRTRLGQVTLNLLVNALEALDPKRSAANTVVVSLRSGGASVELVVRDNGPGIEPAVLNRIFDPFFTTKTDGGTGLGLAISRQIVYELRGQLEVKSSVGHGTSFTMRLPTAISQQ